MAVTDYREMIQKAASKAIGRNVAISSADNIDNNIEKQQISEPKTDKVSIFLDLARSKGIEIKKK